MERILILLLALIAQTDALGCMSPVCGANPANKVQNCDPNGEEICGKFNGRRSNNIRFAGLDLHCPVKEPIFAPISGILTYEMPFGGDPSKVCADQAARIDGTGQWQGYYAIITTVILSKYGGEVSAGERIGSAGNIECALEHTQQSNTNYVQLQVFREGKPVDPTNHFTDCMCTGQICETNNKNLLIGGFKGDSRFNGVKGVEIVCTLAEEDAETTDDIVTRAPVIYSPIEGELIGRKRLNFDQANRRYEGCENEGLFIVGTGKWTDFTVNLYNVRYRDDLGFGRKHIAQGQPIGYRLTCPKASNSIFVEVRFQGTVVNVTNQFLAKDCKLPDFGILY
uniref:Peptidase_M23 domain-containing protein n=1 Tax=Panagrellus redivivus TaxID=6233 RepID=A0A7E4V5E8_PANRE